MNELGFAEVDVVFVGGFAALKARDRRAASSRRRPWRAPKKPRGDSPAARSRPIPLEQRARQRRHTRRAGTFAASRAKVAPLAVAAAADHHEVLRHRAAVHLAHAALKPERRDVMLPAAVGAAADLDHASAATPRDRARARGCRSRAGPSPRDCVTASLHDSAPGQLVTSRDRSTRRLRRGRPRQAARTGREPLIAGTQRMKRF